ncbi:hypothetical protein [Sphingomonas flavalba]|nr:hypothetical protein [Sphingomonas flavalba]
MIHVLDATMTDRVAIDEGQQRRPASPGQLHARAILRSRPAALG